MNKKWIPVLLLSCFILGCGSIELGETRIREKKMYRLKVTNRSLADVIDELEVKTGLRIVMDESVNQRRVFSTTIVMETWDLVLRRVCNVTGYKLREDTRAGVYVITGK